MPSVARDAGFQLVHYLRKTVTFAQNGVDVEIGTIPANSWVVGGGVAVSTIFQGTAIIDVGYASDSLGAKVGQAYASALSIGTTAAFVALDELNNAGASGKSRAIDTTIICTITGATGTSGSADVIVQYVPFR